MKKTLVLAGLLSLLLASAKNRGSAQAPCAGSPTHGSPQMVWVDTDIGDDIDDAFALALILKSPELRVLGISTAFGDTETRARLTDRFLAASGNSSIPVTAGVPTKTDNVLTQAAYARRFPARKHPDAVAALLAAIKQYPGQITLIALGPLFNVGSSIDHDPQTFKQLCRVVMMGGSIDRGYDGPNGEVRPPDAEWNINRDPSDAAKLLASGVPLYLAPLDSTQIHLNADQREAIFSIGNPLTDQLALLYHQWVGNTGNHSLVPTLFDPIAAAYSFAPEICAMQPIRVEVDGKGFTRRVEGVPNAAVCLKSDEAAFRKLLLKALTASDPNQEHAPR